MQTQECSQENCAENAETNYLGFPRRNLEYCLKSLQIIALFKFATVILNGKPR